MTRSGKNKRKQRSFPEPKYLDPEEIPRSLESLFPQEEVDRIADETGFTKRHRKVEPYIFFWSIVLGFGVQLQRTLESLRRGYGDMAGVRISQSSWHDRFKPETVKFLRRCVELAIRKMAGEVNRTLTP